MYKGQLMYDFVFRITQKKITKIDFVENWIMFSLMFWLF